MVPWPRRVYVLPRQAPRAQEREDRKPFPAETPGLLIRVNSAFGSRPFRAANEKEIPALKCIS